MNVTPKQAPGTALAVCDPAGEYLARLRATVLGVEPYLVEQFMAMARSRNFMPNGLIARSDMRLMADRLYHTSVALMLCAQQLRRDCGDGELN